MIADVAQRLGARLKRIGPHEFAGPCPVCGGRDRFSVNTSKDVWNCRGCCIGGDTIDLAQHALSLGFVAAREFVTGGREPARRGPTEARGRPPESRPQDEAHKARALAIAAAYVAEMRPIRGTPGERYLREERRIDTDAIADVLERTDAIGWHPAVYFHNEEHPLHGKRLGAIISVMTEAVTGQPTGAIARTYLSEGRKVDKAKTLGSPTGIVRLSEDADVLEGLFLAEGLETALTAMALRLRPTWATGGTAEMARFPVLPGIEALTIVSDHDPSGAGERAARAVEAAWRNAGCEVRIFRSDEIGDLNDVLKEAQP